MSKDKTQARREHLARMRAEQKRKERRTAFLMWGIGGAVVVLLVGAVAFYMVNVRTTTSLDAVTTAAYPGAQHIETKVTYKENPPMGGEHNPAWQTCAVYDQPINNENAVHSLEHGAVWITYRPDLPKDQVDKLKELASRDYMLMSPYRGCPRRSCSAPGTGSSRWTAPTTRACPSTSPSTATAATRPPSWAPPAAAAWTPPRPRHRSRRPPLRPARRTLPRRVCRTPRSRACRPSRRPRPARAPDRRFLTAGSRSPRSARTREEAAAPSGGGLFCVVFCVVRGGATGRRGRGRSPPPPGARPGRPERRRSARPAPGSGPCR